MATTVTAIKLTKNTNGQFAIEDASLSEALTVKEWGNGWNPERNDVYTESKYEVKIVAGAKSVPDTGDAYYTVAVKTTNQYGIGKPHETTDVSWNIYTIDKLGSIDTSKTVWGTRAITTYEKALGVDLNGDGLLVPVKSVYNADEPGLKLVKDTDKSLYIRDNGQDILVKWNQNGGMPASIENTSKNSYDGSTYENKAVAAESFTDNNNQKAYAVAVKSYSKAANSNVESNVNWSVYKLDESGTIVDNRWTKSIGGYEERFQQDLNGDNVIGPGPKKLETSDAAGVRLARDTDGTLFLVESANDVDTSTNLVKANPTSVYELKDSGGNTLFYENQSSTYETKVMGIQKQSDDTYLVAERNTQIGADSVKTITWNIKSITKNSDNTFTTDWSKSVYNVKNIASYEEKFQQDLNGKDGIGFNASSIVEVSTDKIGPAYLAKDTDGALYIKDESKTLTITDMNGGAPSLESSSTMPSGYGGTGGSSYKSEAIAAERVSITTVSYGGTTGSGSGSGSAYVPGYPSSSSSGSQTQTTTTSTGYKLAIKNTSVNAGKTEVSWQIHTLDATGRLDWGRSSWSKSVTSVEEEFKQDLNGDGSIGFDASKLIAISKSPETNVELKKDSDGALYIISGGTPLTVKDGNGGAPNLEYSNSYSYSGMTSSNESKAIAAEKVVVDGVTTYKLAIKMSNTYNGKTDVNWQIYTLNDKAAIDWSKPNSSVWTKSITSYEKTFNQDLNKDGYVGIDPSSLKAVASDTVGATLVKDSEGALYIKDGTSTLSVTDANGSTPNLENASSWSNGSYKAEAIAVEKTTDGGYKLALKNTNVYDGKTDVNWQVYTLTNKGVLDWSKPGASSWSKSITKFETDFKQDLNGDGAIGVDPSTLVNVKTDTTGATVARGTGSDLYIKDGNNAIAVSDTYGGAPSLEYSNSWTYDGKTNSNKSEVYAAEKQSDGTFKLAVKYTNQYGDTTDVNWQVHTLSATGALDWGKSTWSRSITNSERLFNQDINGDGTIGLLPTNLTAIKTDIIGTQLARDGDKNLYIKDGQDYIALTDSYGGVPNLEYASSWSDGSNESQAFAVEKQSDGTFKLAVKNTNVYSGVTNVNWQVFTLNAQGALDWGKSSWTKSVSNVETQFKQDLNLDGFVGVDPASMLVVGKDTTGATLAKDSDGAVYIRDGDVFTAITDSYGGAPNFEYKNEWTGGSNKSEAVAVQKQSDGTYKLAIKTTNVYNDKTDVNWQIQTLSDKGVLDWSKSSWSKAVASFEGAFEQDLNGDGQIGIDQSKLQLIDSDTNGVRIARDTERALYVQVGTAWYAITDTYGGTPTLENSNTWSTGSFKSEAIAAHAQSDGKIKLLIKNTNEYDGKSDVSWQLHTLSDKGVLDWTKSSWTKSVTGIEAQVNEDLNGDKTIGMDKSKLVTIATDTTGHGLAKDADGALYIKIDANTFKSITDAYGSTPSLEFSSTWSGGSSKSEAYAVEKQTDGSYKLAIKNTNVYNGTTETSWQIHSLSADGVLDWSKSSWTRSVTSVEKLFNQDLDGDGNKGVSASSLSAVATDKSGNGGSLYKDTTGALYIKDGQTYVAVVDKNGGAPVLEYSNTWTGGSSSRVAFAVEKQSDGTYRLAVKSTSTDTVNNKTDVSWEIFTLGVKTTADTSVLDWGKTSYVKNIAAAEVVIQEDMNADGSITSGATTAEPLKTDTAGIKLAKGSDGALYIKADTTLMVQNDQGNPATLEDNQTWTDGALKSTAVAVESVVANNVTTYRIAVKEVLTLGTTDTIEWKVYTLNDKGVVDPNFTSFKSISALESLFKQDLNGDGQEGVSVTSLKAILSDTVGDQLVTDPDGGLYINSSGQSPIQIGDGLGGAANFNFRYDTPDGEHISEAFAIEKQAADSTYQFAVKVTDTHGKEEEVSWQIYTLDAQGAIDWTKASVMSDVSEVERAFNQDLNADGTVGVTALTQSQNQSGLMIA